MHQNRSGWIDAHKAAQLAFSPVRRPWPFLTSAAVAAASDSVAAAAATPREAHPVGNTGITSKKAGNV